MINEIIFSHKGVKFWYMPQHGWTLKILFSENTSDTKGQISYGFTYMKYLELANS